MQYAALATDYDGTLAQDGHVAAPVLRGIDRVRAAGYKTILVTGRQLPELAAAFPHMARFDAVVAENGAELFWPSSDREEILGEPPSAEFLAEMKRLDVTPFSVGKVIFATWRPHESAIADAMLRLRLDNQIIFNKHAVMMLPKSISKATGLAAALKQLDISPRQVVGIGDAENDLPFLRVCGFAAAVDNALESVKVHCHLVLSRDHGAGVLELIDALLRGAIDAARRDSTPASLGTANRPLK